MRKMWIAWENDGSIRSRVLARELGAEFLTFTDYTYSKCFRWMRYPAAIAQTTKIIFRKKPDLLLVQNPSILLAFISAFLKKLFKFQFIIDLHTLYIHPTGLKKSLYNALNNYALNHCDKVVVTNEAYKNKVSRRTSRPVFVLPDKIPEFDYEFKRVPFMAEFNILFICTFSRDEPWQEVINAARLLPDSIHIYISGRNRLQQTNIPKNVTLTGYLANENYQNLLRSVDAIMVLTTADNCLVCGGYEAVAAEKPLILSDTSALRDFFHKAAVFTRNESRSIAQAINQVKGASPDLTTATRELKTELLLAWQNRWRTLTEEIDCSVS